MLRFGKYQGLGNDFIIIDRRAGGEALAPSEVRWLCDRHRGVGADGVLTLWPDDLTAGRMAIQNSDGSESGMCGNGTRCMARFLFEEAAEDTSESLKIRVGDRVVVCERSGVDRFRVELGSARFRHPSLPHSDRHVAIGAAGRRFLGTAVWMGNPHMVIFCEAEDPLTLAEQYGAALECHPVFPEKANVSFVRPRTGALDVVVHERGVGRTFACGSAAASVAAAAVLGGRVDAGEPVLVCLPGGTLVMTVSTDWSVTMEGEAHRVYRGELEKVP